MPEKPGYYCPAFVLILLTVLITACSRQTNPPSTLAPTHEILNTPISVHETATVLPTRTMTPAGTPTLTLEPSATPSPTHTNTPTTTWTPLPRLSDHQAIERVKDLFKTNGGCKLPCWWGLTPGVTSWDEAYQFLSPFVTQFYSGPSIMVGIDGETSSIETPAIDYPLATSQNNLGHTQFWVKDGITDRILVAGRSIPPIYPIYKILGDYGEPTGVFIFTFPFPFGEGRLPFYIVLFYQNQGISVVFEHQGKVYQEMVRVCPRSYIEPDLLLWSPVPERNLEEVSPLVDEVTSRLRPLDEVTDLSVTDFYNIYKNPDNSDCLETPTEQWTYP